MKNYDVIIVGNGILALSLVHQLNKLDPSLKIAVIGPDSRSHSSTLAAGAMLGCFGELTAVSKTSKAGQEKFNISLEALKKWPDWIQKLNAQLPDNEQITVNQGTNIILNARSGSLDEANFLAILNTLKEYKEPFEEIDPRTIPGLDPHPNYRPLRALHIPNEGSVDVNVLMNALQKIAQDSEKITWINDVVKNLSVLSNNIKNIETSSGNCYQAKQVVIAAGASSQNILDSLPDLAKRIPRLFPGIGASLVVKAEKVLTHQQVIRTPNRSFACGFHVIPRGPHIFYMGATNNVTLFHESAPRLGLLQFLLNNAVEQVSQEFHSAKILSLITGSRPVSLDTYPLLGATSLEGLWMLTGTYRDGLHQSPYLADQLAHDILNNHKTPHIFSPERLPLQAMNKNDAIEQGLQHYLSGAYEHGMELPKVGWDKMFKEMLRDKIEKIYAQLDQNFILPPDLLLMFDDDFAQSLAIVNHCYAELKVSHQEHPAENIQILSQEVT